MNKALRKPVIAGNWKMNKTPSQTKELIAAMAPLVKTDACEVVLCVPFVDLATAIDAAKGSNIKIGAQNVHFKESGAYTGEISGDMLCEVGAQYVIVGHSERRQYFGETDITVNLRAKAALAKGLKPIICVGETLDERKQGITAETVARQTKIALMDFTADDLKNSIIAYEPVWAIGTGETATAQQAQEVCALIRQTVAGLFCESGADALVIQYGGSMNAKNAAELLSMPDIDGGLIGGASLKAEDFSVIVKATEA